MALEPDGGAGFGDRRPAAIGAYAAAEALPEVAAPPEGPSTIGSCS